MAVVSGSNRSGVERCLSHKMNSKMERLDAPFDKATDTTDSAPVEVAPLENLERGRWERSWPTIACGAGLFSDGYLNGVCDCIL